MIAPMVIIADAILRTLVAMIFAMSAVLNGLLVVAAINVIGNIPLAALLVLSTGSTIYVADKQFTMAEELWKEWWYR